MKKFALLLAIMLVVPTLLTACDSESQDTAKDYIEAVLKGELEEAQKYACEDFQDATAELIATRPGVDDEHAIRNIDLKYDVGKGNDPEEIIITGAYDLVELNEAGRVIADSEVEYEVAAAVRDRRDIDGDDDVDERLDSRILIDMEEQDGEWCVASLERGYWNPEYIHEGEEDEAEESEEAGEGEEAGETTEGDAEGDGEAADGEEGGDGSADESEESGDSEEDTESE